METAGEILKDLLKDIGIDGRDDYSSIFRKWSVFVGDSLAAHSRVIDVKNGFLVVGMDHPGWYQTFQFQEPSVLKKIRKKYPELNIRGIKVKMESPKRNPEITDSEARQPEEEWLQVLDDLRNALAGGNKADSRPEVGEDVT